ncbi:MAG TPA: glucoamylase family protein [Candidatus Acidoferrum sp.]|nr:glucoamylase family protein [Candidatus Acidoferrum sp.]
MRRSRATANKTAAALQQAGANSDAALLDLVQRGTLAYFWDFAHPVSGMARERSNPAGYDYLETVTTGGTGFGLMALIAGCERGWLTRAAVRSRITRIVNFLGKADRFHGVFPHFLHGGTGKVIPFSDFDDGADLVETAYLMMGLLCARSYFAANTAQETRLRENIDALWHAVEWDWHARPEQDALLWHWSPHHEWKINLPITGWNEALIVYVLACASPTHAVAVERYHRGWAGTGRIANGKSYYGITLPLGPDYGGPLFFSHYSFLGLDPRGLKDRYADYFEQNKAHTLINRAHCLANPGQFTGYGPDCWGLTACDGELAYGAFAPDSDHGIIAPTAALSAMPYAPQESMQALRHFLLKRGEKLWTPLGFRDAFSPVTGWVAEGQLAIDQGAIMGMIENYRSGLLWGLFMKGVEVRISLEKLGFTSPHSYR